LKKEKEEQKKKQDDSIRKKHKEHNKEDIKELPNELYLSEPEEQFVDCDGNVMNIEVRGERTPKGISLKAKDVGDFGIDKI